MENGEENRAGESSVSAKTKKKNNKNSVNLRIALTSVLALILVAAAFAGGFLVGGAVEKNKAEDKDEPNQDMANCVESGYSEVEDITPIDGGGKPSEDDIRAELEVFLQDYEEYEKDFLITFEYGGGFSASAPKYVKINQSGNVTLNFDFDPSPTATALQSKHIEMNYTIKERDARRLYTYLTTGEFAALDENLSSTDIIDGMSWAITVESEDYNKTVSGYGAYETNETFMKGVSLIQTLISSSEYEQFRKEAN